MPLDHTAIRMDAGDIKRADALIPLLSSPGFGASRSIVLRMAVSRGLSALEAEYRARDEKAAGAVMTPPEALAIVQGQIEQDAAAKAQRKGVSK